MLRHLLAPVVADWLSGGSADRNGPMRSDELANHGCSGWLPYFRCAPHGSNERHLLSTLLASPQRSRNEPTEPEALKLLPSSGADLASPAPSYRLTVPILSNTLSRRPIASHVVREAAGSNGRKNIGFETVGLVTSLSRHGEALPCFCRRRVGEWTDASISNQTGTCTSDLFRIARSYAAVGVSTPAAHIRMHRGNTKASHACLLQEVRGRRVFLVHHPSVSASRQWPPGSDAGPGRHLPLFRAKCAEQAAHFT